MHLAFLEPGMSAIGRDPFSQSCAKQASGPLQSKTTIL